MKMIWIILRSESVPPVIDALRKAGFHGMTCLDASGYGKEHLIPLVSISNSEILQEMLMMVIPDNEVAKAVIAIRSAVRERAKNHPCTEITTNEQIFVTYVEDFYTIRIVRKNAGTIEHEKDYCNYQE